MTQVSLSRVSVEFGATLLLQEVSFTISRGDRWGVVGRNGSGKTTILRLITGDQAPSRGTVFRAPVQSFSVMDQQRDFGSAASVWEAAAGPFAELLAVERGLGEQAAALAEAGDACTPQMLARYDRDLERFIREGGYTIPARVDAVLQGLGFDPDQARLRQVSGLSGGEQGRLALGRQLAAPSDLLLLDEPTNHLDLDATRWLEDYLLGLDTTVVLVSHDRAFLEAVVNHVLHLESEAATPYASGYEGFIAQRAERRLARQRAHDKQAQVIKTDEEFIRRNIAGRNSAQAKGRRRRLARIARLGPPPGEEGVMALRLDAAARGGDQALLLDGVRVIAGDRPLIDGFSARVRRGEIVGIVGSNGAGKSSLLRVIAGELPAAAGEVRLPESMQLAHYRQDLAQVPAESTLYDLIVGLRPGWGRGAVQGHLGRFGFSGDAVHRRAGTLSGGERARVALAMLMLSGANLLLLDEPTNHLDVESIEVLEDAIETFDGTVILVSHDRALLRALTDRVWLLHGGRITDYPGGFAEWERASAERDHAAKVSAAEEEALRRVRERKQTRRPDESERGRRSARRTALRALARAEEDVAAKEGRIAELQVSLENPELYLAAGAGDRAAALGRELETEKRELEAALAAWEEATRAVDAFGSGTEP